MTDGVCRRCGCTEDDRCVVDGHGNVVDVDDGDTLPDGAGVCSLVEPDLCSACVEAPAPAPMNFDGAGKPLRGAP